MVCVSIGVCCTETLALVLGPQPKGGSCWHKSSVWAHLPDINRGLAIWVSTRAVSSAISSSSLHHSSLTSDSRRCKLQWHVSWKTHHNRSGSSSFISWKWLFCKFEYIWVIRGNCFLSWFSQNEFIAMRFLPQTPTTWLNLFSRVFPHETGQPSANSVNRSLWNNAARLAVRIPLTNSDHLKDYL